ncbi:hypothetical protein CTAM01_17127 [Colletotrichum tamarilloi]|uniref:Uncharacterized protein n=1 Tax=Colletotrichum tamarilloi TaxID=1209934 RepID=A0ABQ9QGI8_9PEZI|nr:uncharacterized protein CTAM01_17127 [Colletotrichum tamarilloi]KAK1460487.1 hypothetical protein CTAM01_17127 [Colletotrichum tamarilloi]
MASHLGLEEITTVEYQIGTTIDQTRRNGDLGDVDVKGLVDPEIIAGLSRFAKNWNLEELRVEGPEKSLRQHPDTIQPISLGSIYGKGHWQWEELDELGRAGTDIDHLHLDLGQTRSVH